MDEDIIREQIDEPKEEDPLSVKPPEQEPIIIPKEMPKKAPVDKSRIINTSAMRGINESKILENNKEEDEQLGLDEAEYEEKRNPPIIVEDEDLNEIPNSEKDYMKDIIDSDPVLKAGLTYAALKRKEKTEGLREDEKEFMHNYEESQAAQEAETVEKMKNDALAKDIEDQRQAMMKEYYETKKNDPSKVATLDEQKLALSGEESFFQILKFVKLLKKAKKSGGKVLVQVFKSRRVLFQYTQEDLQFVEFFSRDEKGNTVLDVCRFSEYKYSMDGSPMPVLFAVQGFAEGFDFYDSFRKNLDSETVNNLMIRSYHAGFLKGAEIREPEAQNDFMEKWAPILMVVAIVAVIITLYFGYMTYDKLKFLNSDSMVNLAKLAKAYADANGEMIIQTASNTAAVVVK